MEFMETLKILSINVCAVLFLFYSCKRECEITHLDDYNIQGSIRYIHTEVYNLDSSKISESKIYFDKTGKKEKEVCAYFELNQFIASEYEYHSGFYLEQIFQNDTLLVTIKNFLSDGRIDSVNYFVNDECIGQGTLVYNSLGLLTLVEGRSMAGDLLEKTTYHYNEQGELIRSVQNQEVKVFSSDNRGDPIFSMNITETDTVKFKYEYDDRGNWIVKNEFVDDILGKYMLRRIKYRWP